MRLKGKGTCSKLNFISLFSSLHFPHFTTQNLPSLSQMYTQRLSIALRSSSRTAFPHTFQLSPSSPYRLASSVATADLPKAKPHDKVPFSAPPKDETKGELGQVHLPSMEEKSTDHKMAIVRSGPLLYRSIGLLLI